MQGRAGRNFGGKKVFSPTKNNPGRSEEEFVEDGGKRLTMKGRVAPVSRLLEERGGTL